MILKCINIIQNSQKQLTLPRKKINLEEFLYISSSKSPPEHVDSLDHAQGTCHAMDMPKNSEILMSRDPGSMRLNLGAQVLQETALLQQKVEDCGKKLPS